jgi:outer membrane protein assembly factor BamB
VFCSPLWSSQLSNGVFVSSAVVNGVAYVESAGTTDGPAVRIRRRWLRCTDLPTVVVGANRDVGETAPAVAGGMVYVASSKRLFAFNSAGCGQSSGEPLWFFVTQGSIVNTPVVVNGRLYVSGSIVGSTPEVYVFHLQR